jgi:hypothetical protein
MPGEAETNPHLIKLSALIAQGDARLSMLNCSFEDLIRYIPDIAAETDLERHLERVRKLDIK